MLCEVDSDGEEGLFRLWEVGDISNEEAAATFSSDEEEEEEGEGAKDVGGVRMLVAAGDLRPRPAYVWGQLGTRAGYVKIMIDRATPWGTWCQRSSPRGWGWKATTLWTIPRLGGQISLVGRLAGSGQISSVGRLAHV